jgi:ParB-like chromosome segregation protein Spo0J/cell division protein ZapA (FtsZ GTPase activity inhibitor)
MAPRGQFNRRQEGQRFLTPLESIAANPRNLREEWEYETDEFEEFKNNVENTELIQDPAICSVDAFTAKYPEHANDFGPKVQWVLLAGERRYRALLSKKSPTDNVPVVLRDKLLTKGDFVLLSENNYRKGWDPIQEAMILDRIRREEGLTYDQILEKLGGEQSTQSGIKRRSDISKRIALLKLQDGPLRRAIREGKIGLEPAYTLVSRLKEPQLIEQGWTLMQEEEVTAKVACDTLLGKTQTPDSSATGVKKIDEIPEGGSAASAPAEGVVTPVQPAERGTETAPDGGEQQPADEHEITPTPAPLKQAPRGDGFADETVRVDDVRVPAQQSPSSGLAPANGAPSSADADKPVDNADAVDEQDVNARMQACTKVLSSATWSVPGAATRRIAVHALLEAPQQVFDLAAQIAEQVGLTDSDRVGYVAALEAADDSGVLTMAYAVALATDELHLRSVGDHLDARAADYLKHLHDSAGYDVTGYQSALEAISSAKL